MSMSLGAFFTLFLATPVELHILVARDQQRENWKIYNCQFKHYFLLKIIKPRVIEFL